MSDEILMLGKLKEKLIQRKQEWARDGRLLTGNQKMEDRDVRLPRGQRLVTDWPVLDLGIQPDVPTGAWSLSVDGLVEHPLSWDWDQYMAQPQFEDVSDVHCVTAWSRFDNLWQGVSTQHIIELAKPKENANHVILYGLDGYTTNVTLAAFSADDALIAHSWEGEKLSRQHGGPVRAIIPQYYLWKSAKWVNRLEFVDADQPGFWEVRGYHNEGDPWKEERYGF
jgi:DMSO/TMAO reductase YedYZ molybdopterin-dependent catalytic subunit